MNLSAAKHREGARLRKLAEIVTTPTLRQFLLDTAATYDKLAVRPSTSARVQAKAIITSFGYTSGLSLLC
jgi:hypothetical protein